MFIVFNQHHQLTPPSFFQRKEFLEGRMNQGEDVLASQTDLRNKKSNSTILSGACAKPTSGALKIYSKQDYGGHFKQLRADCRLRLMGKKYIAL